MIDMTANMTPMTVQMPADLIAEVRRVAAKLGATVDELVQEACAQLVEPYSWKEYESEFCRPEKSPSEPGGLDKADAPSAGT